MSSGMMMMVPCWVFFGSAEAQLNQNASSYNFNALASQLSFYGYISEWGVQYTRWTSSMVPIRCVINVSFTMLPTPTQKTSQGVWRDLQQLGKAPYTVQTPYAPGYNPPPGSSGATFTAGK